MRASRSNHAFILLLALAVSRIVLADASCEFDSVQADLGEVLVGTYVKHEFHVRNNGDQLLTFKRGAQSCGCEILTEPAEIPAGKADTITVAKNVDKPGPAHFLVEYLTNDPARKKILLQITYRSVGEVYPDPALLTLTSAKVGAPQTAIITVATAQGLPQHRVLAIRPSVAWIQVQACTPSAGEAALEHRIQLVVTPPQQGVVRESIAVRTDNPRVPLLEVPIRGKVEGVYQVDPQPLRFAPLAPGQSGTAECTVTAKDGRLFAVASDDKDDNCTVSVTAKGRIESVENREFSSAWSLRVCVRAPAATGLWKKRMKISVTTESGEVTDLGVEAVGLVRSVTGE